MHRSVTHVRHYRGAEQEYRERQRNQVPPHAALPFPHPAVVYNCRLSRPYHCPRVKVRDQGLPSRKEWGEGTRADGDVWKYIRPGSLYVRETEGDGLILSAGSSGKHRGEHNNGDQDDKGDGEAVARHVLGVVDGTKTGNVIALR